MMRTLHEIHKTEVKICEGSYRYLKDGKPTGPLELWMISRLPDQSIAVRSDIDPGDDSDQPSSIGHLIRKPDGRPKWLRMRLMTKEFSAASQYNFQLAVVKSIRQTEGFPRMQDKLDIAENYELDYHPVISHDYVWRGYPERAKGKNWSVPVFSPALFAENPRDILAGRALRFNVTPKDPEMFESEAGTFSEARRFDVVLSDDTRAQVWYDEYGIPLRWYYPEKELDFLLVSYGRYTE